MAGSIRFGDWVWNPNTLELRKGSHVATLEPRVARLLEYLVTHPGELLSHDRIVEDVWDGRIVSDEAVRRAVFNLRQALAVDGAGCYIRTIHKKGYVATFPELVAANQPSASQSASPPTRSGLGGAVAERLPGGPEDAGSIPVSSRWRGALLLGVVGAIALAGAILVPVNPPWRGDPASIYSAHPTDGPVTIAVLPFTDLSDERNGETLAEGLAEGLAEELLGTLSRNRDLRVTARSSAFQFKGQNLDVHAVGQRLGVRYLLEGSVLSLADRLRIHARLIDTRTGLQVWDEAYDHQLADWFVVQENMAAEVANALRFVAQREDKAFADPGGTISVEAHLEVLRARQLLATRAVAETEMAIEHLQRALALDPDYALAYSVLADAILIRAESTTGVRSARPIVAPLLDRALLLDPGLGEAYALRSLLTDDASVAERDLRRGLELNPSYARGYELLANLQSETLKLFDLAADSVDRAIALDPLTPGNFHAKAMLMMAQGLWPESAALERYALALNPGFRAAIVQLAMVTAVQGNFAEAIELAEQAIALDPQAVSLREQLMLPYLAVGDLESVVSVNSPPSLFGRLAILWAEGDIEQAANLVYDRESTLLSAAYPEIVSQIVLLQALADRDFPRALAMLSGALPYEDALPPEAIGWQLYAYANRVQLLEISGDPATASKLQAALDERMVALESRYPRHAILNDHVRAVLLAHTGHSDEACAVLDRSTTPVPRLFWRMVLGNPAFDGMRDSACLLSLLARFEAHIAVERARIDVLRRTGQIPDRSTTLSESGTGMASRTS